MCLTAFGCCVGCWASGNGFYSPLSFHRAESASSAADNLDCKFISTIKQEKFLISLLGLTKHCGILFFLLSREAGGEIQSRDTEHAGHVLIKVIFIS